MNKKPKKENLKPYKKGESGNPNGRPLGARNVSTVLKELLEEIAPDSIKNLSQIKDFLKKKKVTNADAIAGNLLHKAIVEKDLSAIKEIIDRTEGKAMQGVELSGKDGGEILYRVVEPKADDGESEIN